MSESAAPCGETSAPPAEAVDAERAGLGRGWERALEETVKRAVQALRLPTKGEVDALRQRLQRAEERMDALLNGARR